MADSARRRGTSGKGLKRRCISPGCCLSLPSQDLPPQNLPPLSDQHVNISHRLAVLHHEIPCAPLRFLQGHGERGSTLATLSIVTYSSFHSQPPPLVRTLPVVASEDSFHVIKVINSTFFSFRFS